VADKYDELMRSIKEGEGASDADLESFRTEQAAAEQRLTAAMVESQKDPRNLIDKLKPALLGLGAIIDYGRGKWGTREKYAAYREELKKDIQGKRGRARQKLLDVVAKEEMLGKGRARSFEAGQTVKRTKIAETTAAANIGLGVGRLKLSKEQADKVDPEKQFKLQQWQSAYEILGRDSSTHSAADIATLKTVIPGYESADEMYARRVQEAWKITNNAIKNYDTEGMAPEEIAALQQFLFQQAMASFITEEASPSPPKEVDTGTTQYGPDLTPQEVEEFYRSGGLPGAQAQPTQEEIMRIIQQFPTGPGIPSTR
jgi:hypothetical protein